MATARPGTGWWKGLNVEQHDGSQAKNGRKETDGQPISQCVNGGGGERRRGVGPGQGGPWRRRDARGNGAAGIPIRSGTQEAAARPWRQRGAAPEATVRPWRRGRRGVGPGRRRDEDPGRRRGPGGEGRVSLKAAVMRAGGG